MGGLIQSMTIGDFLKLTRDKIFTIIGLTTIYFIFLLTILRFYGSSITNSIIDVIIIIIVSYFLTNISFYIKEKYPNKKLFVLSLILSAIIIVIVSGVLLGFFPSVLFQDESLPQTKINTGELENIVSSCITSTANEKLKEIKDLPNEELKRQLNDYIEKNINTCLSQKEQNISIGGIKTKSEIGEEEITIFVNAPIKLTTDSEIIEWNYFSVKIPK